MQKMDGQKYMVRVTIVPESFNRDFLVFAASEEAARAAAYDIAYDLNLGDISDTEVV